MKDTPIADVDINHHIQRSVLLQLRQNGNQTYQQLKPDGLEGNAYNYHLKNLKKSKLIRSVESGYQLTEKGEVVTDAFSFEAERLVFRPHMYTYLLVTSKEKVLLYKPTRRPMPGVLGLPSGKLHYGDDFKTSIAREAKRRQLDEQYKARLICSINIRYMRDEEVVFHRPGNIWHIAYEGELTEHTTPSGHSAWFEIGSLQNETGVLKEVYSALGRLQDPSSEPIEFQVDLV